MGYITNAGLMNLKNYKYVSGGYSPLDKLMNPYWEFVVSLVPTSIAPNLITLTGMLINIFGTCRLLFFDTSLTQRADTPSLVFMILCGFIYQTLDAIDGKQARRTGSSSPLGQLFDHGCDAVCLMVFVLTFQYVMHGGASVQYFMIAIISPLTFYSSQFEEYHTHVFRTNIGGLGVTETIMIQFAA